MGVKPGSQLTSALNKIKLQVSKKTEAQLYTQKEERKKGRRGKTLSLCYEGSLYMNTKH